MPRDLSYVNVALYDEALAADILGIPRSTLHWWLEGGTRSGRTYAPVLRTEPTGSKEVTWGELVEARYLAAYRRDLGVRLSSLRQFISILRTTLNIEHPLAHSRPWVGESGRLLVDAQFRAELEPELWACFEPESGLVLFTAPAESFLEKVEFEDPMSGYATRIFPVGRESPVVIDPEVRYGSPAVRGIPTDVISEMVQAGDSIESIASGYELELELVIAALDFERQRQLITA